MRALFKPVRLLAETLTADASPRQLAWGVALGMLIGLVPKGNLTALALMTLVAAVKVNLGAVALSTLFFSWVGTFADPHTHRLGEWLLRHAALQEFWTRLYNRPVAPWTGFNNTVVLGSLLAGLALLLPVYALLAWPASRCLPPIQKKLAEFRIVRLLWGDQIGAANSAAKSGAAKAELGRGQVLRQPARP